MEPHERIIFPLDVDSLGAAQPYLTSLKGRVGLWKVGHALLLREGPAVLDRIVEAAGGKLFVDLKFHDIPNTVRQAAAALSATSNRLRFFTVHTCDGEAVVSAAVRGAGAGVGVLGITVLTSVAGGAGTEAHVVGLAQAAQRAGCQGIVCSGREVAAVKKACGPAFLAVVPGIRPDWTEVTHDDQQRAVTPAQAIAAGADYLVIGRPIAAAKDPAGAAGRIAEEIARALV
ncbi:MAG: orotidine-5'-phosphate decarboxylase [Nitrospirae bacterium]|nr:orotidine-5'-phosphate decarboxylase [Nitrospirota bacterium]